MKILTSILDSLVLQGIRQALQVFRNVFQSDEERLDELLSTPADQAKFERAIDEVIKSSTPKDIVVNGSHIILSN